MQRDVYPLANTRSGIEAVADGHEIPKARIAGGQHVGIEHVALAPMGPAAVLAHDRLHGLEVRAPLHAAVLVDGDVEGVAIERRAQQRVVGGDDTALERERDRITLRGDPVEHPAHRHGAVGPWNGPLHLGEPDRPLRREDLEAVVDVVALREKPRRRLRQFRDQRRNAAGQTEEPVPNLVLQERLVDQHVQRGSRPQRRVGPVAPDRERLVGVREDEELEVIVLGRELVEISQHPVERYRLIDAVQSERRDRPQRHRRDRTERADSDARRAERETAVGIVRTERDDLARAGHELDPGDLGRDVGSRSPVPCVAVEIAPEIV